MGLFFAHPTPPTHTPIPLVAMGAIVTGGSDLGEGGQGGGGGEEHRWDPFGFRPEVTRAWLRPSELTVSSALLGCDLGRRGLPVCVQWTLGQWVLGGLVAPPSAW